MAKSPKWSQDVSEEQTCFNLGQQRMSLSVLSDIENDQFWRNWPLGKINFNQKKKKPLQTIQLCTTSINELRKVPLPLSIINSIVADKGLCKYPRGISTVNRYCHRFLYQSFSQFSYYNPKSLFKKWSNDWLGYLYLFHEMSHTTFL